MSYHIPKNLKEFGHKIHSQNDEDGIIDKVFSCIPPRSKYFVEFGIGPNYQDREYTKGIEGNCTLLRRLGWTGLFMDGGHHPDIYEIKKEYVTPLNIDILMEKYGVPENVDIVSIDVDGQDIWIWLAMRLRPQMVIIEYNSDIEYGVSCAVPFNPSFRWDGTSFYGSSFSALEKVASAKGYMPIYSNGVNIFFVLKNLISNPEDFKPIDVFRLGLRLRTDPLGRKFVDV